MALRLGDFTFTRGEVPESIGFGASQELHVHTLVGGARVIDAMGAAPLRPAWSGWLSGPQALARARYLKTLAEAGQPLALRFGEFAYTIVIAEFSAEFRAGPYLPYAITLEVVSDHSAAGVGAAGQGLVQMVAQDLASAHANGAAIGDSGLIAAIGVVAVAVLAGGATAFTPATVRPILPAIAKAQAQAAALDMAASEQIAALVPLADSTGAIGPDALSQFGAGLAGAAAGASRSRRLNATIQVLERMTRNLATAGGTADADGVVLTTGTGDLYHLAAAAYGDPRAWTRIAQANGLSDPAISGITQLVIPPADTAPATGVLNA